MNMRLETQTLVWGFVLWSTWCICMDSVQGYIHGDIIPTFKKIQTKQLMSSEWTEVLGKYCPKFTTSRRSSVSLADEMQMFQTGRLEGDLKMMFSFDHQRFITPYITVVGTKGHVLEYLEFTFIYSGDDILDFKWKTHYSDELHKKHASNSLDIEYKWEEYQEMDIGLSMAAFLFSYFLIGMTVFMYVVIESVLKSDGFMTQSIKDSQPLHSYSTFNMQSNQQSEKLAKVDTAQVVAGTTIVETPSPSITSSDTGQSLTMEEITEEEVLNYVKRNE